MKKLFAVWIIAMLAPAATTNSTYRSEVEAWRQKREAALKADGGWLTVTGLFWLHPGENTIGSDASNDVVLPEGSPSRFGVLKLEGSRAFFKASDPAVKLNGNPVKEAEFHTTGDALSAGAVQLLLLKRGERYALRLKDANSKLRRQFTGLKWYPVQEDWRVIAQFVPFETPAKLSFDSVIGETEIMDSPGYVTFERGGHAYKLQAAGEKKRLFFVIRDQSSGKSTYAAARFLYSEVGPDGNVVLDFNKAENPPCAFTPYATCPLPPPQNRLAVAVEAGEQKYEGLGH